jgi:hypothetical protein
METINVSISVRKNLNPNRPSHMYGLYELACSKHGIRVFLLGDTEVEESEENLECAKQLLLALLRRMGMIVIPLEQVEGNPLN